MICDVERKCWCELRKEFHHRQRFYRHYFTVDIRNSTLQMVQLLFWKILPNVIVTVENFLESYLEWKLLEHLLQKRKQSIWKRALKRIWKQIRSLRQELEVLCCSGKADNCGVFPSPVMVQTKFQMFSAASQKEMIKTEHGDVSSIHGPLRKANWLARGINCSHIRQILGWGHLTHWKRSTNAENRQACIHLEIGNG